MLGKSLSILCAVAATMSLAASASAANDSAAQPASQDWSSVVAPSAYGGVIVGNPDASVRLVEYISYTCPQCADFSQRYDSVMKRDFVADGAVLLEIRPYLRNIPDYAASMLASCGGAERYLGNHKAIFGAQPVWLARLKTIAPARQHQWEESGAAVGMAMILADTGLDRVMTEYGMEPDQISTCLADAATFAAIQAGTQDAREAGVDGTPSFVLNGQLLNLASWDDLRLAIATAIARKQ